MLLYTEDQLEKAYEVYRLHQVRQDLGFMSLEHFRLMYEELAEEVLTGDMEESYNGFSI
jgi:hypothetical protein|tara:strand:+ start:10389 stop:10565 length:177 start_codon:yes stop_codon:yes gene_type:complete